MDKLDDRLHQCILNSNYQQQWQLENPCQISSIWEEATLLNATEDSNALNPEFGPPPLIDLRHLREYQNKKDKSYYSYNTALSSLLSFGTVDKRSNDTCPRQRNLRTNPQSGHQKLQAQETEDSKNFPDQYLKSLAPTQPKQSH